jgi:hypothetical protein
VIAHDEPDINNLELTGMRHRVTLYAQPKDFLERDTQIAMLILEPSQSALLDWEDVEAIHRWSGKLIADRAAHQA